MEKNIWIDIINPSHPLFFKPLINELKKNHTITITLRERGETVKLAKQFGLSGETIGKDYEHPIKKTWSLISRTFALSYKLKKFDCSISFENPMSIMVSKLKNKKSILLLDNDLKYKIKGNFFQEFESRIKLKADCILIPRACENTFYKHDTKNHIVSYNGYKEDFYIADYKPDNKFLGKLPFEEYVIVRAEALASFYVNKKESIVRQLFDLLRKENVNVLFLPRDKSDFKYKINKNVFILKEPVNGLDLIYYSNAVLTGSGTMAREAACMGKTAVSFFPSDTLLSVDRQLVKEKKMLHSRDPKEIIEYVVSNYGKKRRVYLERSKLVKKDIIKMIKTCIDKSTV